MGLLIDTSVLVGLERAAKGDDPSFERLRAEPAYLAAITASELLHGVHRADSPSRRARREAFVEALLDAVPVLPFDLAVARVHAGVWAELAQTGRLIGAHDLMIAATALVHDLALLTRDARDFDRIDGLRLETWPAAP